jgi:intraflagellar transport protein 81
MLGFLNMLNFKPGVEGSVYQQALLQGDPQAIHPMLSWLLTRLPELRTRAYLATFLSSVELPEHLAADDELGALLEHLRELQADFKEQHKCARAAAQPRARPLPSLRAHSERRPALRSALRPRRARRSLDKLGQQIISPLEIKRAIVQMEEDREQLLRKIEQLSGRLQNLERYEETLAAATGLRQEQDEQMKLQQRVAEQRQSYARAEQQLQALDDALRDARAQDLSSDGESLLRALEAEVGGQRAEFETELPAAIDEARARLDELEGALAGGPITQDALREVRAQLARLDGRERELRAAAAASGGGGDDDGGLGMFRQQAALITHKHKAMLERLQASTNTRDALERQLIAQTAALAALEPAGQRSGVLDTKSDDFKRYTANLRGKTANYGKQRAELSELRAEYGVLYRTEQLLQAQARAVGASLARAEGARGIDGYSAVQSQLDKESDAKAAADEAKGQSLEQISQLVDEINEQIRSRKNRLAPQIKELRALRASSQEVESEHLEKKGLHDSAAVSLEAELSKLQEEVSVYEDDLAKEERCGGGGGSAGRAGRRADSEARGGRQGTPTRARARRARLTAFAQLAVPVRAPVSPRAHPVARALTLARSPAGVVRSGLACLVRRLPCAARVVRLACLSRPCACALACSPARPRAAASTTSTRWARS